MMRNVTVMPVEGARDDGGLPPSRPSTLRRAIRRLPGLRGRHYTLDYRPTAADRLRRVSNGLLALLVPLLVWEVVGAPAWVAWAILGVLGLGVGVGFVAETVKQRKR